MNILIVEDQDEKSEKLRNFCYSNLKPDCKVVIKKSLRGALREVLKAEPYDLIFLDMSMPNFDPSIDDPLGGSPESFAGLEFVSQLKLRRLFIPVVVVTQYRTFEKGKITLKSIDLQLKDEYSEYYLGSVYYSSADKDWELPLRIILQESSLI